MVPVMRTLFISDDRELRERARKLVSTGYQARVDMLGGEPEPDIDQLACIGSTQTVVEQIEDLRKRLGMTHFVAARIRIAGLDDSALGDSMRALAEIAA